MLTRFAQKVLAATGAALTTGSVILLDAAANADTWLTTVVAGLLATLTAVAGNLKAKDESNDSVV